MYRSVARIIGIFVAAIAFAPIAPAKVRIVTSRAGAAALSGSVTFGTSALLREADLAIRALTVDKAHTLVTIVAHQVSVTVAVDVTLHTRTGGQHTMSEISGTVIVAVATAPARWHRLIIIGRVRIVRIVDRSAITTHIATGRDAPGAVATDTAALRAQSHALTKLTSGIQHANRPRGTPLISLAAQSPEGNDHWFIVAVTLRDPLGSRPPRSRRNPH